MLYRLLSCLIFVQVFSFSAMAKNKISLDEFTKESLYERKSSYFKERDIEKAEKKLRKYEIDLKKSLEVLHAALTVQKYRPSQSNFEIWQSIWKGAFSFEGTKIKRSRKLYEKSWSLIILGKADGVINDLEFRALFDELRYQLQYPVRRKRVGGVRNNRTKLVEYPPALIQLSSYYKKLKRIQKMRRDTFESHELYLPIKKANFKDNKNKQRYTFREKLYAHYTPIQIKAMGSLLEYMFDIMMAQRTYTVIELSDKDDIVLEATLTDQYRLAIRLYEIEKRKAERIRTKIGRVVDDIDIVFAALELGIIAKEEVSILLTNPDFFREDISWEKKLGMYIKSLALLGLQTNPATAPYVLIPTLLYRSYQDADRELKSADEDLFLFTLPERN